tara:strand:+ start:11740 stop:12051 length:312 start_codon:yes stop_codon:yes gene_type:complete
MSKKSYVKSEIVKDMQELYQKIPNAKVERIVEIIFKYLSNALSEGKNIELRQFGTFKIKNMPERHARNPKTGDPIKIEKKNKIKWKTSKLLNQRINKGTVVEE